MNHQLRAIAILFAGLAFAGCTRDAAPPSPADTLPAAAPATQGAVISKVDHASPASASPGFDARAFAGTYAGTLPCADCPGIDTSIAFTPEGGYTLGEIHQDGTGSNFVTKGTWTMGDDGRTLLLDPEDKDAPDRWLEVVSPTELRTLDHEGKAIHGKLDHSLRRK